MNKEQKKPQEISSATKPRRICYLCEEEIPCEHYPQQEQEECYCCCHCRGLGCAEDHRGYCQHCQEPQEDIFDEFDNKFKHRSSGTALASEVKDFIRSNFIAKRDLRKLLEEGRKEMKQEDNQYIYSESIGYNSALNDILASIEKT